MEGLMSTALLTKVYHELGLGSTSSLTLFLSILLLPLYVCRNVRSTNGALMPKANVLISHTLTR